MISTLWTDRKGAFAPLKATAFAAALLPALWLLARALAGDLGSKPFTAAIHDSGDWAVRFLLAALAVTPLRAMLRRNDLLQIRRTLGLATFGYAVLHMGLYVGLEKLDLVKVASEIALRSYLTIGFITLVGLAILAATSTDSAVRRLGAERWNGLHRGVYPLTGLALLHFAMQTRIDVSEPVLMTGLFLWLMGWRWLRSRRLEDGPGVLALLSVAAAVATALAEAAWYGLTTGVAAWRVLAANLDLAIVIRPAWWVLLAGSAMTLLLGLRQAADALRSRHRGLAAGGGRPLPD